MERGQFRAVQPRGIRRGGRWLGWVALALGWWLAGVGALATRFVMLTPEDLARGADLVVHGRVTALETTRDTAGRIHTRVELRVDDVWKGRVASGGIKVLCGGGTLGETEVRAVGQAEYAVGDEVVAYLVRSGDGTWVTLGLAQGRFQVTREEATGRRWVRNLFWGAAPAGGGTARLASWPPARAFSLDELKRRTREVAP